MCFIVHYAVLPQLDTHFFDFSLPSCNDGVVTFNVYIKNLLTQVVFGRYTYDCDAKSLGVCIVAF